MMLLFLGDIGGGEIVLIMFVVLLFFGSKQIPQLARGLGKGIREFKDAANGIQREIEKTMHEPQVSENRVVERIEPKPLNQNSEPAPLPETESVESSIPVEPIAPVLPEIKPAQGSVAREA
jgi:sec-independent protein translocase protein TatA